MNKFLYYKDEKKSGLFFCDKEYKPVNTRKHLLKKNPEPCPHCGLGYDREHYSIVLCYVKRPTILGLLLGKDNIMIRRVKNNVIDYSERKRKTEYNK